MTPEKETGNRRAGRIEILDLWRTVAIVCMVVYHLLYDLTLFGFMSGKTFFSPWLNAFQVFICGSFIIVSGISARLSRNNIKRGAVTFLCALLVSAGALIGGQKIMFGILHFLGCAMVIYGLLGKYIEKLPGYLQPFLFAVLFFATRLWTRSVTTDINFLFPLGFLSPGFTSADYFPIMPWLFLFLFGAWLGGVIVKKRDTRLFKLKIPAALAFPGRHSLIIYLLHQPVLYGLIYLFSRSQ